MKQLVVARQFFSASHAMYFRSLRNTGSALLQFSSSESALHHHHHLGPPSLPPPPSPPEEIFSSPRPPFSPSTDTNWSSSIGASPLPPPPPPPPPQSSTWDFWDPFVETTTQSMTEEEWEDEVAELPLTRSRTESTMAPPSVLSGYSKDTSGSTDLAMVKSTNGKNIFDIIKEVDDYFLKAADAGAELSAILEVTSPIVSTTQTKGGIYLLIRGFLDFVCQICVVISHVLSLDFFDKQNNYVFYWLSHIKIYIVACDHSK